MRTVLLGAFLFILSPGVEAQNTSVYTDLAEKKCRTVESTSDEGGSYKGVCPGVAGFKLEVVEGDLRQSVNVIAKSGERFELNLWNISGGFSSVGPKAEWRMKGKTPVGLILRFNVNENPDEPNRVTSYLVVVKLTDGGICVTEALRPTRSHNFEARKAADKAADRPCRTFASP